MNKDQRFCHDLRKIRGGGRGVEGKRRGGAGAGAGAGGGGKREKKHLGVCSWHIPLAEFKHLLEDASHNDVCHASHVTPE